MRRRRRGPRHDGATAGLNIARLLTCDNRGMGLRNVLLELFGMAENERIGKFEVANALLMGAAPQAGGTCYVQLGSLSFGDADDRVVHRLAFDNVTASAR